MVDEKLETIDFLASSQPSSNVDLSGIKSRSRSRSRRSNSSELIITIVKQTKLIEDPCITTINNTKDSWEDKNLQNIHIDFTRESSLFLPLDQNAKEPNVKIKPELFLTISPLLTNAVQYSKIVWIETRVIESLVSSNNGLAEIVSSLNIRRKSLEGHVKTSLLRHSFKT